MTYGPACRGTTVGGWCYLLDVYPLTIRYGGQGNIQLDFEQVHLHRGLVAHRFVVQTRAHAEWLTSAREQAVETMLLTGQVGLDFPPNGFVAPLAAQVMTLYGSPSGTELSFSVTEEQLIAIERARGENYVRLRVDLQTTLLAPAVGVVPVQFNQAVITIDTSRWHHLLEQAGTEVGVLIRVRSSLTEPDLGTVDPDSAEGASLSRATAQLRRARGLLSDHNWQGCVEACRKVLENLGRLQPDMPSAEAVAAIKAKQRNQEQRWAAVFHDVMSLTSAAHHDDPVTIPFTWRRSEAEALLAASAGLLSMYASKDM